jgi:hypothetical protein
MIDPTGKDRTAGIFFTLIETFWLTSDQRGAILNV